ncbi:MAG: DNA N-6-adenine-methyltransferase [Chloroflexota bacterium]
MTAGRKVIGQSQDWGTPRKYVQAVKEVFGGIIHLDPCSNRHSLVNAIVEYCLPEHDGLKESWNFPTIYVNPPYGVDRERGTTIKDWLRKCEEAHRLYQSEVIALVPVATNTGHWKRYVYGKATALCFLYDTRLRFLVNGRDAGKGAPMSCAMIYWGRDWERFFQVFIQFGAVVNVQNLQGIAIGRASKNDNGYHQLELEMMA